MDNSITRGFVFFINVTLFAAILVTMLTAYSVVNLINESTRGTERESNITGQEYYAAMKEYEPYIGTSSYDGQMSMTEALAFIRENISGCQIYVIKNNMQYDANSLAFNGMPAKDYVAAGYISGLKEFLFDGYSDDTAYFQRYIELAENGSLKAVYLYRRIN